eukprot:GHVU01007371.1.p3 GENE.GHVU01007371.1~~GHVU01007371.1.p3  ORF type:complete len:111 (-),score=3.69 GHVU01007371.1:441-773(-)
MTTHHPIAFIASFVASLTAPHHTTSTQSINRIAGHPVRQPRNLSPRVLVLVLLPVAVSQAVQRIPSSSSSSALPRLHLLIYTFIESTFPLPVPVLTRLPPGGRRLERGYR